jgi:hypothetical protein
MADIKHPNWQCPKCKMIIFWAGATSHVKRHHDAARIVLS